MHAGENAAGFIGGWPPICCVNVSRRTNCFCGFIARTATATLLLLTTFYFHSTCLQILCGLCFFTAAWRPCLWMPQNSLTSKEKIPLFWTDVEASLDWNIFFRFANRRNFSIFKKFSFHELQFFTQTLLLFRGKLHATFLLSISLLTDQTKFLFLLIITLFSIQYA